jgi:hypothetical protein
MSTWPGAPMGADWLVVPPTVFNALRKREEPI